MSDKKYIVYVDGKPVEVNEEIYTYIKRSDWNSNYADYKRKRDKIIISKNAQTVKVIPRKEDSLERLKENGIDFPDASEPLADAVVRKMIVQQALAQLTASERFIILRIYFEGTTERELAKELRQSQQNIHKIKRKILCKLYEILKN